MTGLPPALAELSREAKLALLERLAGERARAAAAAGGEAGSYPLAFAQQPFWFLAQLDPGSYADHVFRAFDVAGPLDGRALGRAVAELVRRHAALRTRFAVVGGEPRQVVAPPLPGGVPLHVVAPPLSGGVPLHVVAPPLPGGAPAMPVVDLTRLPAGAAAPLALALAGEEARRRFDLARGPLFRARLLRLGPRRHALLLCLHHIVADGWSLGVLLRELSVLYGAFAAGAPTTRLPLAEPQALFVDFAAEQRQRLQGEVLARELAFWRRRLDGAPAVLELPADHPRPHLASRRGGAVAGAVPDADAAALRALATAARATPFMALLAVFDALLYRYTGQGDLVVGVPAANRDRFELESVVGCFAGVALVRARPRRGTSFRELLAQVRAETLAVLPHSELPFEQLVAELQPDRGLSHNPLFQVMFALQPAGDGRLSLPGLELAPLPVERRLAKLDLTLDMVELPGGFGGYFEYSADLFEAATIARLAAHFSALLAAAAAAPDRGVGELPMLAAAERRQLLVDWNQRYTGAPGTVPGRIAEQARRTPGAPAVLFDDERLSFAELLERAGRLARALRRLGVGPETAVGVCLERSLDLPVVLLAVLAAGGAWVPLDPEYPRERLALMIADAGVSLLLTQERLLARLPAHAGSGERLPERLPAAGGGGEDGPPAAAGALPPVVAIDRLDLAAEDGSWPDWPIHPESLAYVVFTSGSTGRPKGVAVPHRAMANHVAACARAYRLGPDDRVLQFTSISFDITCEEILPAWVTGAAVVPRPPGLFPSFAELEALIVRHGITVVELPTAYWHEWVGEMVRAGASPPPPLRLVVIGTEQALPRRVAEWLALAGDRVRLNNSYASTEATVTAVVYEPAAPDLARFRAGDRVPVGKTLDNCCAYVLDAGLEPVPVGVPGDVYIGGPNVSRGYLSWPELTAGSFLPDPFAASLGYGPGQRMYAQGDVGRWLPTGDLEYLGRRDDQVKIRGFRIEPAEVAAAVARHPAVKDCVVVVKSDGALGKRLVAYLTGIEGAAGLDAGVEAGLDQLRAFLRESLPEHMLPSALVALPALPLTANGRVDQRALPEPPAGAPGQAAAEAAPRSALAEILAGIWCEVLGLPRVGPGDDFWGLGGHSLLGTQVVSRVREQLRVELPMRALFENPTLAGLARRIEELRRAGPAAGPPRIEAVARGDGEQALAASFAQQRLWFLDRLDPGRPTYNMPLSLHLRYVPADAAAAGGRGSDGRQSRHSLPVGAVPELDVAALAAAVSAVVRRHEALRTTFAEVDGQPRQLVHPAAPVPLPVVDLAALDPARRAAESRRRHAAEARRPFSLERGPLLRLCLLRLGGRLAPCRDRHFPEVGGEYQLLATLHHIVADGWSLPIFVRELTSLYGAITAGERPALPELPIQYADFAHWQRRWLDGETDAELDHWRQRLRGLPPVLELPADRPRPAVRTGQGASCEAALGSGLAAALHAAASRLGATPFMVALAGLAALLHRCGGQESFAVRVPVAGRNRVEIEPLIGCFVNTLALRCDVAAQASGRALVEQVRDAFLDADAHQALPFEKLVEELAPERSLSHAPLFQVLFAYQNLPPLEVAAAGLQVTQTATPSGTAKFDLMLSILADREPAALYFEYATELFDAVTVVRLVDHYSRLLAALAADPGRRIGELPLLGAAQRHQLAVEWNPWPSAAADGRGREVIHRLFEAQAERTPERPAVSAAGVTLTYRELDERANRLAWHLLAAGVAPGDLVGLCLPRSLELVVAILATLKAGAAYLPLDPTHPPERLAFALADGGAAVVLAVSALAHLLPARPELQVIAVDAEAAAIAARSPRRPAVPADPGLPAYVIYTSGSTGRPKGVMIPHGHVTCLFHAQAPIYGFGPEDVWTLFHSCAFDFSVWEIWGALLYGGRLVVVPEWESRSPEAFYSLLHDERVTVLGQTPGAFRQLLWAEEAVLGGTPPDLALRLVIFGGEALELASLAPWFRRHGDATRLVNMYGITETTVQAAWRPIRLADLASRGSLIGAPIADWTLHLADPGLAPVPIGVPGEILVGGEGVAPGYLRRPELTAERFVPDPFGPPGARLYRSGDLARRLPDGDLEYLGRIDRQVKIRGFRIELGEIEAALCRHPAVAQGVVLLREDTPGNPRLVAYYVPATGEEAGAGELRAALRQELPEYMVPSWFAALPALPLTVNGKVDRKALPAPGAGRADLAGEWVAPSGPVEEQVAAIWGEVLGRERIGAQDSFFELGGHSLLATRVLSRLRAAFDFEVPLRDLFLSPTVAGLAAAIERGEIESASDEVLARLLGELEGEPEPA